MLSISTWNYLKADPDPSDLDRIIREINQNGFGIELWLNWSAAPELVDRQNWEHLKRIIDPQYPLSMHSRLVEYNDWDVLKEEIDMCHFLGSWILVVHPKSLGIMVSTLPEPILPEHVECDWETLAGLLPYARERGVRIALENGPLEILRGVLEKLKSHPDRDQLGICIDVGHANLLHDQFESPVLRFLDEFETHLIHLHLSDNYGLSDEHRMPGQGSIDWDMVIPRISGMNYTEAFVLESKVPQPLAVAEAARRFLGTLVG